MISQSDNHPTHQEEPATRHGDDLKLASLWVTFRNIHAVVVLILIFAIVQMVMLKRVCDGGMKTSNSLEHEGLPYLDGIGVLREDLALFRLYSFEYLFARTSEQAQKRKELEAVTDETRSELRKMEMLMPAQDGRVLATNLETALNDLNQAFGTVEGQVNTDFAAAMRTLDRDIPSRIQKATTAANALESYGYRISAQQANDTIGSFGWIKENAILFGSANIVISLGAVVFVLLAARRTRIQLSSTMGRLQEKTAELTGSLSLLHATLDSTADGIVAMDPGNKVLCFNRKFASLWGFSGEMLQRTRTAEIMTLCSIQTTDPEQFLKQLESHGAASNQEGVVGIDFKDGRAVECFVNRQWINRQPAGVVLSFRDITERRRAEAGLNREKNLLRALMDNSGDCIYFKDAESRFVRCSLSMAKVFKTEGVEELIGRRDSDFFLEDHAREAWEDEQEIMRSGEPLLGKVEKEQWPGGRVTWALTSKMPLRDETGKITGTFGISKDITAIKEAEAKLSQVHKQLLDASRQAGMAEVATSVLHNVGNVLNSVNVSSSLISDKLRSSKAINLSKSVALMRAHEQDLGNFLTSDPKGKQLLDYLSKLSAHLLQEQEDILREAGSLVNNIVHIKEIVSMQQSYARASGVQELVEVKDLVEDAIRMNDGAMSRHKVKLNREYAETPPILTEKHKVLQILINLIRNAKYACDDSGREDKQITMRVANGGGRIKIMVEDNGVGIPAENLTRIFNHGFTTRKEGHGFGLHSGALAAKELGGTLTAASGGPNRGATFVLELPAKSQKSVS